MLRRQTAGIALGLAPGIHQQHVPATRRAALAEFNGTRLAEHVGGRCRRLLGADVLDGAFLSALLGLQDKTAALIEVDTPGRVGSVAVRFLDRALEDVVVLFGPGGGGLRLRDAEDGAKLGQE
jgi:hypothetical protein